MFVGQTRKIVKKIEFKSKMMAGKDFFVSYCPERLVEGNAIEELEKLPQIISGKTKYPKTEIHVAMSMVAFFNFSLDFPLAS